MLLSLRKQIGLLSLALGFGILTGCAAHTLKGIDPQGRKVYLGPLPIEKTEAYQNYVKSARTDVDRQRYLFERLKSSEGLEFFHDGSWYNSVQAYRGGMWLMRNRYKKGQDTREFIMKYIDRSETSGKLRVIKYPDGTLQQGSAVLLNELDLLEDTAGKN